MSGPAENGIRKELARERELDVPPNIAELAHRIAGRQASKLVHQALALLVKKGAENFADAIQHF